MGQGGPWVFDISDLSFTDGLSGPLIGIPPTPDKGPNPHFLEKSGVIFPNALSRIWSFGPLSGVGESQAFKSLRDWELQGSKLKGVFTSEK